MSKNKEPLINLTINGHQLSVSPGTTILAAAQKINIEIPSICHHSSLTPPALCRLCVVEVTGIRNLQPACAIPVSEGMEVQTNSKRVRTSRRIILELLASTVDLSQAPEIQVFLKEYRCDPERFGGGLKRQFKPIKDNPFYIRDYAKCVMCWRCIQACAGDIQNTYALTWGKRGIKAHVTTFLKRKMPETTCVFCGNCVAVCPSGALKGLAELELDR